LQVLWRSILTHPPGLVDQVPAFPYAARSQPADCSVAAR
jgi:hypothetical protein